MRKNYSRSCSMPDVTLLKAAAILRAVRVEPAFPIIWLGFEHYAHSRRIINSVGMLQVLEIFTGGID